jgi:hypothetical protein
MEWIEASIPYAIASVGFAMWPTTWLPVLAAVAFSTFRWRAALASGFLMLVFLAVMLPSGIFGPHLALANYGFVMLAGAVLAPALLLPRSVWPTGATEGPLVARPLWQAARDLHIVGTLAVLAIWFDRGLFYVAPDISDHQVAIYMVMLLAVAVLATRLTAGGIWTLVQRPLGRLPRVRRAVAAVGAIGFLSVAQLHLPMPLPLMAAGDLAASSEPKPSESRDCATITAHPEHGTLELWGAFCEDTP